MTATLSRQRAPRGALPACEGDRVHLPGEYPEHVATDCGAPARTSDGWACLSCRCRLANDYQRDLHCAEGTHVLARLCPTHGPEVPRTTAASRAHAHAIPAMAPPVVPTPHLEDAPLRCPAS